MKRTTKKTSRNHDGHLQKKRLPLHESPMEYTRTAHGTVTEQAIESKVQDVFKQMGHEPTHDDLRTLSSIFFDGIYQAGLTDMTSKMVRIIRACGNDSEAVSDVLNCLDKMKDTQFFEQTLNRLNEASGDREELVKVARRFIESANVQKLLVQGFRHHG